MIRKGFRKRLKKTMVVLSLSMVLGLCGCGETPADSDNVKEETKTEKQDDKNDKQESQEAQGGEETPGAPSQDNGTKPAKSANLDSLLGDWELIAELGGDYEYQYLVADEGYSGNLSFYQEDGAYFADFLLYEYGSTEIYGMKVSETKTPKIPGNDAAEWYAELDRKNNENVHYDVAKIGDDLLKLHVNVHNSYEIEDTGEIEEFDYSNFYVFSNAEGSRLAEIEESYRYIETVTVHNVKELYNAMGSKKHIILAAGKYNLSQLTPADKNNENINYGYYDGEYYEIDWATLSMNYFDNLFLEGEAGAEVMICTEDPSTSPLEFTNCRNIILKNLTLGHEVEPGYCSGAVLDLYSCTNVTIDNCNLYGSGTYGINGSNNYNIVVADSDIYECTEGLIYLVNSGSMSFKNCKLRDSSEYNMFQLRDCWGVEFQDCSITNNTVNSYAKALIDAEEAYNIVFRNCTFKDNIYETLFYGNVEFENCKGI